jgi:hypothetical protein
VLRLAVERKDIGRIDSSAVRELARWLLARWLFASMKLAAGMETAYGVRESFGLGREGATSASKDQEWCGMVVC